MADIQPFRGLRPIPDKVQDVASPPYDVLNSEEARTRAKNNLLSFLHVIKPEIDLEQGIDSHDPKVYARGAESLSRLINDRILVQDENPCFYVYKLQMGDHCQIGLVAVASVQDYVNNVIKKHEHTRPDKEEDRMNHIHHLRAQTGPVFLTYRADDAVSRLMEKGLEKEPVYDFTGDYDVRHTLYVIDDTALTEEIRHAFSRIEALYVADGHHRSAAAVRVRDRMQKENPNHTGKESYNYFLSVIFPDNQMRILDYNRIVADLDGLSKSDFFDKISESFDVRPYQPESGRPKQFHPPEPHQFGMYIEGEWYILHARENSYDPADPIASLDVSILQVNLLAPVLGVENPRTNPRIDFVGGIRGLDELERRVDEGRYAVAFSLHPTTITELLAVADADQVMPPKSTWFEPKLRSGVVIHKLD